MTASVVIPWITVWSAEVIPAKDITLLPGFDCVRYLDQEPDDLRLGVLWHRERDAQGEGEPHWKDVHASRQCQAMSDPRCQVCGVQLPQRHTPWLLPRDLVEQLPTQRNLTITPPTCEACWPVAEDRCPHIRRTDAVRVHVTSYKRWGFMGDLYHPGQRTRGIWVPFRDEATAAHMIARQLVVQLGEFKEVQ